MCALCGAFGADEHWTDGPGRAEPATPPAERAMRAATASRLLRLYGLRLTEWRGRFTLTSRTGRIAIVDHFGGLWAAAERLTGRPCDPLDPEIIDAVEGMSESR
jgi:hypothetical protein